MEEEEGDDRHCSAVHRSTSWYLGACVWAAMQWDGYLAGTEERHWLPFVVRGGTSRSCRASSYIMANFQCSFTGVRSLIRVHLQKMLLIDTRLFRARASQRLQPWP